MYIIVHLFLSNPHLGSCIKADFTFHVAPVQTIKKVFPNLGFGCRRLDLLQEFYGSDKMRPFLP